MGELKFSLKVLLSAMLLTVLMQIKVGSQKIEQTVTHFLKNSAASEFVQSAAAGGALALRNMTKSVQSGAKNTLDGFKEGAEKKAIR